MTNIKVSALTTEERKSFIKSSEGRFVLSKKMKSYDWDTGSIWSLIKDPTTGELVLARNTEDEGSTKVDKTASKEVPLVSLGAKENISNRATVFGHCKCGRPLTSLALNGVVHNYCSKCNPAFEAMLKKTAVDEIVSEEVPSNISAEASVDEGEFYTKLLPTFQGWVEFDKCVFATKEDVISKIKTAAKEGEISETTANGMRITAARLFQYAQSFYIVGNDELFSDECAPKVKKANDGTKVGNFISKKPDNMSPEKYAALFRKLKSISKRV
jgi:hypothetical protein